jgi:hypothetical protein
MKKFLRENRAMRRRFALFGTAFARPYLVYEVYFAPFTLGTCCATYSHLDSFA